MNLQIHAYVFSLVMCIFLAARRIVNACPVILAVPCRSNEPECEKV